MAENANAPEFVSFTLGQAQRMDFTVHALRFEQMRIFAPAFLRLMREFGGMLTTPEAYDVAADCILAATKRDYPEFVRTTLNDLDVTPPQLTAALDTISGLTGMFKKGPAEPGEAAAQPSSLAAS